MVKYSQRNAQSRFLLGLICGAIMIMGELLQLSTAFVTVTRQLPGAQRATTTPTAITAAPPLLKMGLMDSISKAFANDDNYGPPPEAIQATASHILVETPLEAQICRDMIANGEASFADCAIDFSTCPSASKGGSLGTFTPGTMVPEFDKVVFNPETKVGQILGPIQTDFGYHVILLEKRTGGGDKY